MKKKMLLGPSLIHLFIITIILFMINTSVLIFWESASNNNITSTSSLKNLPDLSWGIAWGNESKPICISDGTQDFPQICSDGAGGAIIAWADSRGANYDIYAQRINSNGDIQWSTNGRTICTASNIQYSPQICSDDAGGAIIVWDDWRGADLDIYAQRVNSVGDTQWISNGEAISTASQAQYDPKICSNGTGGAIIAWEDERGGVAASDIYAQLIYSKGDVQWANNGTIISAESQHQQDLQICSDGAGGAIITWEDERGTDFDIYAQRINSTGGVEWTTNGRAISIASSPQHDPQICSDGVGGAIITWTDERSLLDLDIYAQRINSAGTVEWTTNGRAICTESSNQFNPQIISDGNGGAIITWQDERGADYDIYAQRVSSTGSIQWILDGIEVCTAVDNQAYPNIITDGSNGAIITWQDSRGSSDDIYAQRVNSAGNIQWDTNGSAICTKTHTQHEPQACIDGTGGAIITWADYRTGSNWDIYAQRIKNDVPTSSHPTDIITTKTGSETINWTLYDDCAGGLYRVLANDTTGSSYMWKNWTSWTKNVTLNVPINRTVSGSFEYTIEYYDEQNAYGTSDTVIVEISDLEISGYNILIIFISAFISLAILKRKIKTKRSKLRSN
jgi:hypothetical protein